MTKWPLHKQTHRTALKLHVREVTVIVPGGHSDYAACSLFHLIYNIPNIDSLSNDCLRAQRVQLCP